MTIDREDLYADAAAHHARMTERAVAHIRTILSDEPGAFRSGSRLRMLRMAAQDLRDEGARLLERLDEISDGDVQ